MFNIGAVGYSISAIAYLILSAILLASWRGRVQGGWLLAAASISFVWSVASAYFSYDVNFQHKFVIMLELLRNGAWFTFLFVLLPLQFKKSDIPWRSIRFTMVLGYTALVVLIIVLLLETIFADDAAINLFFESRLFFSVICSVIGLILIEQLFRNATAQQKWSVKFLCIGIGGIFAFDFYLYADALLIKVIDQEIWGARGFVSALVVPFIAMSAARNPQWSFEVFVSREFVFYTSTLLGAGIFLVAMAVGGYYIRIYGGSWGGVAQLFFFFGAVMMLALLLFSGHMRARLRVFLNKHFFSYRYDYREEWLRFIDTLSGQSLQENLRERVILAVAEIVESPGGLLWQVSEEGQYHLTSSMNLSSILEDEIKTADNSALINFLRDKKWVINLDDYRKNPKEYDNIDLPGWISNQQQFWLIVPLLQDSNLAGFIVLARGRAQMSINWEDRDLLKTTGRQAANYLALRDAVEALVDARQFEAFNRLSAYVVHDLKNIAAQLALVLKNSEKHRNNPEFMDDALNTVSNSVTKMNRMLLQLRKDRHTNVEIKNQGRVSLDQLINAAIQHRKIDNPCPQLISSDDKIYVQINEDRMLSVIEHLIQNAQEATKDDGYVKISLERRNKFAVISIEDNGCGMDSDFIKNRLFKPFDTTKGNAGMGIGVYESREFIQSIGGKITVSSEVGNGTTFNLYLKIHELEPGVVNQEQKIG